MDTRPWIGIAALALCAAVAPAVAEGEPACRAVSGERTLPLVELYTSEGCSSCPPADRWIAVTFASAGQVRAGVIAFHVDYWDRLGWPDRYARADWSARQQAIARAGHSATVYTPQVLLQGRDFEWRDGGALREVARASDAKPGATIALEALRDGRSVSVAATAKVTAAENRSGARLLVAYVDGGHETAVKNGENAGATLRHEYVVRELVASGAPDGSGQMRLDAKLPLPADRGARAELVAFVERDANREVLQSLVLPLDRCR